MNRMICVYICIFGGLMSSIIYVYMYICVFDQMLNTCIALGGEDLKISDVSLSLTFLLLFFCIQQLI